MKFCNFLFLSFCVSALSAQPLFDKELIPLLDSAQKPFYFGVASGDPHQNDVIIWTHVWSDDSAPVAVKWSVCTDTNMQQMVASGETVASASTGYTVKVDARALQPNTTYFYRFQANDAFSPIGRTKTAPEGQVDNLRFGVVSCSNYEHGYFNVYRLLANRNDLHAIIHLGDYIYEYGVGHSKKLNIRKHIPAHEILTLQDYRSRYAQYRLDKDLQEAHRLHPFITVWDDHEIANNCYRDGAGNHQDSEGDWEARKAIAKKVYFEWIPISGNDENNIVRKLSYGDLADIFMLDGRTEGRCKQPLSPYDTAVYSPGRTMLGKKQTDWLVSGVRQSSARWKVLGNQVVFSELDAHKLTKKNAINTDAWDGYPLERKEILDSFNLYQVKNLIILTGDIHSSWAFDLVQNPKDPNSYDSRTGKGVIGAEFVTPSISSGNLSARVPRGLAKILGGMLKRKATNPHLRFQNVVDHGYILLDLNVERTNASWVFSRSVKRKTERAFSRNTWSTRFNDNRLVRGKQ